MTAKEQALLLSFLRSAGSLVEFGCGGSTVAATAAMVGAITSFDSSREWLDKVASACAVHRDRPQPRLVHVDIGPTTSWGYPVGDAHRILWPRYATAAWDIERTEDADLFLVDGRFRVSCTLEALRRCRSDAVLLIHDFGTRPAYHVIREFALEVGVEESLSAFVRRPDFDDPRALAILEHVRYQPV
jgi:hypothetical protein